MNDLDAFIAQEDAQIGPNMLLVSSCADPRPMRDASKRAETEDVGKFGYTHAAKPIAKASISMSTILVCVLGHCPLATAYALGFRRIPDTMYSRRISKIAILREQSDIRAVPHGVYDM